MTDTMPIPDTRAVVTVTQEDREAAADGVVRRMVSMHGGFELPWMQPSVTAMRLGEQDMHPEVQAFARHRIAAEARVSAREEVLEAENAMLRERGVRAVLAYHMAICAPKGVVPLDDLYDPVIAAGIDQNIDAARAALHTDGAGS